MRIESLHLEGVGPFENTTIEFPKGGNPDLADVYLLVGQNGCGKTTALQVLSQLIGPPGLVQGELRTSRRFSEIGATAHARSGALTWLAQRRPKTDWSTAGTAPVPFVGLVAQSPEDGRAGFVAYFQPTDSPGLDGLIRAERQRWWHWVASYSQLRPEELTWAAFAYAGQRTVSDVRVSAIQELSDQPLKNSLSFYETSDSQRLAQWVANQDFMRLKAQQADKPDRVRRMEESINRIERAISEVIGVEFKFQMALEDVNVRVNLGGETLDFGLLPEGLKSIVSWISDLLMRLERVGWRDDLPIHEREFLLLLDEIDVHLHPSWQRKLLPVVQRLFPKAQIIASTHSPFVVASLADGAVIELKLDAKGRSTAQPPLSAPLELSYSATMRRLFGIDSDFDLETEKLLNEFQAVNERVMKGEAGAREELARRAGELLKHGEEVAQLVHFALKQTEKRSPRPTGT